MDFLQFYLIHKNIPTAVVVLDKDNGEMLESHILRYDHAPIGHTDRVAFKNWWERRAVPKHQMNQSPREAAGFMLYPDILIIGIMRGNERDGRKEKKNGRIS